MLFCARGLHVSQSQLIRSGVSLANESHGNHILLGPITNEEGLIFRRITGTPTVNTTLSSAANAGVTSITTPVTLVVNQIVQIGLGDLAESRVVTGVSGAGPFTATFSGPLSRTHASGASVYVEQFFTSRLVTSSNCVRLQQSTAPSAAGFETISPGIEVSQGGNIGLNRNGGASGWGGGFGCVALSEVGTAPTAGVPGAVVMSVERLSAGDNTTTKMRFRAGNGDLFTLAKQAAITGPTGGFVEDAECRTAVFSIIAALQQFGLLT